MFNPLKAQNILDKLNLEKIKKQRKNKNYLILTKIDPVNLSNQINHVFDDPTDYLNTDPSVIIGKLNKQYKTYIKQYLTQYRQIPCWPTIY